MKRLFKIILISIILCFAGCKTELHGNEYTNVEENALDTSMNAESDYIVEMCKVLIKSRDRHLGMIEHRKEELLNTSDERKIKLLEENLAFHIQKLESVENEIVSFNCSLEE